MSQKGKQKECREGCGTMIYLSDQSGKWLPYNLDGSEHRCRSGGGSGGGITSSGQIAEILAEIKDMKEMLHKLIEMEEHR